MHEYRRLVEQEMKAREEFKGRGGQQRLADEAGLSKQVISYILRDKRERLTQVPDDETVEGLAKAFRIEPEAVWAAVAVSLGLPSYVVPSITHEVKVVKDEDLLGELASRLDLVATFRTKGAPQGQGEKTGDELAEARRKAEAAKKRREAARRRDLEQGDQD